MRSLGETLYRRRSLPPAAHTVLTHRGQRDAMSDLSAQRCVFSSAYLRCTASLGDSEIETRGVLRSERGRPGGNNVGRIIRVVSAGVQSRSTLVSMVTASHGKLSGVSVWSKQG